MLLRSASVLLAMCIPVICSAEELIFPKLLDSSVPIEQTIANAKSHAEIQISGKGNTLSISYDAKNPIAGFFLFLEDSGNFDPLSSLYISLPAGSHRNLQIPLIASPKWSPASRNYRLHLLSDESDGPQIFDVTLTGGASVAAGGFMQLWQQEPYTPSAYHRLRGYSLFGISVLPLVFLLIVIIGLHPKMKPRLLPLLITGVLLVNARFSIDLLRMTYANLSEWSKNKTYAEAGSLHEIARVLTHENVEKVALCHDGTTYAETLLRYLVYPIPVEDSGASHILVHSAFDWSYTDNTLRCGDEVFNVVKVKDFRDGSILFVRQS